MQRQKLGCSLTAIKPRSARRAEGTGRALPARARAGSCQGHEDLVCFGGEFSHWRVQLLSVNPKQHFGLAGAANVQPSVCTPWIEFGVCLNTPVRKHWSSSGKHSSGSLCTVLLPSSSREREKPQQRNLFFQCCLTFPDFPLCFLLHRARVRPRSCSRPSEQLGPGAPGHGGALGRGGSRSGQVCSRTPCQQHHPWGRCFSFLGHSASREGHGRCTPAPCPHSQWIRGQ